MDGVQGSSQNGSSGVTPTRTFDMSVETEVLQLLNFIRRGPFTPEEKNSYRDTVLDFATEKNTASLHALSETLMRHGVELTSGGEALGGSAPLSTEHTIEPVSETKTEQQAHVSETQHVEEVVQAVEDIPAAKPFGGARPQPQFGASAQPTSSVVSTPTAQSVVQEPLEVVSQVTSDASVASEAPATPSVPDAPPNLPTSDSSSDLVTEPEPSTAESVVPSVVPEQETGSATPEAVVASEEVSNIPTPVKPPIERIKDIKRRVNDAVGNPVHLIDADNNIGREYMNALLNAMKQVSDGSGTDMDHAMQRLEKAYESVMRLLVEHPLGQQVSKNDSSSVPLAEAVTQAAALAPESDPAPMPPPAIETSPAVEEAVADVPTSDPATQQVKMDIKSVTENENEVLKVPVQTSDVPITQEVPVEAPASTMPPIPVPNPEPSPEVSQTAAPEIKPPAEIANIKAPEQPQSLAAQLEEKRNAQDALTQENLVKHQANAASADPLLSPEVSSGLHQLLVEWKLFKSSGFLGTGPSGHEHPLYKQLSAMPMTAVVAGRFEGATPQIRQSISDYMNGWYYEQNVAHDMNETFEHYLRRVVKRILEKQKASASVKPPIGA